MARTKTPSWMKRPSWKDAARRLAWGIVFDAHTNWKYHPNAQPYSLAADLERYERGGKGDDRMMLSVLLPEIEKHGPEFVAAVEVQRQRVLAEQRAEDERLEQRRAQLAAESATVSA